MSLLNVSGISKKEGDSWLLKNINFIQESSVKIAIAGATGSGKTTLLKTIGGLIQPDSGEVLFEETRVKGPLEKLLPGHPHIAYLSQNFELRNNYRVEELLQMAGKFSSSDAMVVYQVCRIDHLLKRWSDELSGGERQRVAFAKALVSAPKLLLLDEPFSNLDAIHRQILKSVITDIETRLHTTCILVSHDPTDLLSWAEEIIVLNQGKIVQRGTPEEIYSHPVSEYVAALFGRFTPVTPELEKIFPLLSKSERRFLRPSDFKISFEEGKGIKGNIYNSTFMGGFYELEVDIDGTRFIIMQTAPFPAEGPVFLAIK